ncbi:MAG: DUF1838 family protein [Rhodospirillaceae bacterium]|nr:DUF1838 family protein [Rhodospirillaceae bacterium]
MSAPAHTAPTKAAIDFTDPVAGHRANVKLRGTLGNGWVWRTYWGDVLASLPEGKPVPLFKFEGVIKARWTDNGDGSNTELLFDVSTYRDWNTGQILEKFQNPLTNETNDVIGVWDGPTATTYGPNGRFGPGAASKPTTPVVLPWRIQSGRAWLAESAAFERPHPLSPAEWPKASSGPKTMSAINVNISGELRDLENKKPSAPHDLQWTSMRSWLPWLELGQRPGYVLTMGIGRKINGPDELPASAREIIAKQQPNFITDEQPWAEALSSWERYKKLRQP